MPIYEYSCTDCTNRFEKLTKYALIKEPLGEACPSCGATGTILQEPTTFSLGDPIAWGHKRPDAGFNEVLSKIKEAHPNHSMGNSKFAQTRLV
jgi:putative FmdB family regulatory protein